MNDLTDCDVLVLDVSGQIQVDDCHDCTIVTGPVAGSAFFRDCSDCRCGLPLAMLSRTTNGVVSHNTGRCPSQHTADSSVVAMQDHCHVPCRIIVMCQQRRCHAGSLSCASSSGAEI